MDATALYASLIAVSVVQAGKETYTSFRFNANRLSTKRRVSKTTFAILLPLLLGALEKIPVKLDALPGVPVDEPDPLDRVFEIFSYIGVALLILCNLAEERYKRYRLAPVPWPLLLVLVASILAYGIAISVAEVMDFRRSLDFGFIFGAISVLNFFIAFILYMMSSKAVRIFETIVNCAMLCLGVAGFVLFLAIPELVPETKSNFLIFGVLSPLLAIGEVNALIRFRKTRLNASDTPFSAAGDDPLQAEDSSGMRDETEHEIQV